MEIALYYAPNTCALAPYVTLTEAQGACACRRRQDTDRERRHSSMGPPDLSGREDPAQRSLGRVAGDFTACLVCQRHSPLSKPHQQPGQSF